MQLHINDLDKREKHESIPENDVIKSIPIKMSRQQPSKISYEDILSKMNMFVSNGKLHLIDRDQLEQPNPNTTNNTNININPTTSQNSYIFNKYFKDEQQPINNVRKPKTLHEYKMMAIDDYIERERIKRLKTRKLMMFTSDNLSNFKNAENKLFTLSK